MPEGTIKSQDQPLDRFTTAISAILTLPSTEVKQSLANVKEALELNRIYFSDKLCGKIEAMMDKSTTALARMNSAKLMDAAELPGGDPTDAWLAVDVYVQNEVYQTRLDLVNEFHKLIGV